MQHAGILDRETRLPLYVQVAERVRELIERDKLDPGMALPSESVLRKQLEVSRGTIRQALQQLELDGRIERRQGRGTFVAVPPLERALPELTSFTEHLTSKGLTSSSRLVRYERLGAVGRSQSADAGGRRLPSPDSPEARLFPDGVELARVVRLRLANGTPVGLHTTLIPLDVAERAGFTKDRLSSDERFSLYAALAAAGYRLRLAEEHLRARLASAAERRLLGVGRQSAVMSVLRLTRDEAGQLLEAVRAVYLGDHYDYVITLERAEATQRR